MTTTYGWFGVDILVQVHVAFERFGSTVHWLSKQNAHSRLLEQTAVLLMG